MEQIDIGVVLQRHYPRAARLVPRQAMEWLRRLLHESEINDFLRSCRGMQPCEVLTAWLERLEVTCEVRWPEGLDPRGRYMIVANHPFGGLDGVAACEAICRRLGDVRAIVNDLLMHIGPLRPLWIPVNKSGAQHPEYAQLRDRALKSDVPVLTFPAGLCSRRTRRGVEDTAWRTSFVRLAERYDRTIIPLYVEGTLSERFYRVARLRKALGIRFNFEMVLLCDEMFRQRGAHIVMRAGEPVGAADLAAMADDGERCRMVRRRVYALAANTPQP